MRFSSAFFCFSLKTYKILGKFLIALLIVFVIYYFRLQQLKSPACSNCVQAHRRFQILQNSVVSQAESMLKSHLLFMETRLDPSCPKQPTDGTRKQWQYRGRVVRSRKGGWVDDIQTLRESAQKLPRNSCRCSRYFLVPLLIIESDIK